MSITAPLLWLDGSLVPTASATVPLLSHAVQRGSAVFDVGSFHETPRGVALFRAREHAARFLQSCAIVGLELTWDENALVGAACEVVRACGKPFGMVRWSAVFAAEESDFLPRSRAARTAVAAQLFEDPPRLTPLKVALFDDARKAAPAALPPAAKAAAAYLGPMLHRLRAAEAGADEIVLLDHEGLVAEAPTANIFAVRGGALVTPKIERVLRGITRDTIQTLASEEGIPFREAALTREDLEGADEAFLSSTSLPIAPIGHVNDRALPHGPITKRLAALLDEAQRGARPEWITLVSAG